MQCYWFGPCTIYLWLNCLCDLRVYYVPSFFNNSDWYQSGKEILFLQCKCNGWQGSQNAHQTYQKFWLPNDAKYGIWEHKCMTQRCIGAHTVRVLSYQVYLLLLSIEETVIKRTMASNKNNDMVTTTLSSLHVPFQMSGWATSIPYVGLLCYGMR